MEILRWLLFAPSAAAGYLIFNAMSIPIGILLTTPLHVNGVNQGTIDPINGAIGASAGVFGWFALGIYASPKKVDVRIALFVLTIAIVMMLGYTYLYYLFSGQMSWGKAITFFASIGMTSWVWFSKKARLILTKCHASVIFKWKK